MSLNRRSAIHRIGVLLGATVSTPTVAAILQGCAPSAAHESYTRRFLSQEQYTLVSRVADVIIPKTDTPGAIEAGVPAFIDTLLEEYYPQSQSLLFHSMIDSMDMMLNGAMELSDAEFSTWLEEADRRAYLEENMGNQESGMNGHQFHRWIKEMVVAGFYTSEIGANQELHVMPYGPLRHDQPLEDVGRTWA